jgi:ribosome-associated translation inhibitor RaiA
LPCTSPQIADYRRTHVEIDTQDCDLPDDEQTRIQQDLDLLAQELLEFPDSQLFLKVVHHPWTERYHAQAKLKLPGKTIITGRYSPWLHEALTHCLDRVRHRAEQYKESPRSPSNSRSGENADDRRRIRRRADRA